MLATVLSTWVFVITIALPGRAPVVHQAASFATVEACETFKARFLTVYQDNIARAQARMPASPRPRYEPTAACVERS
jgi:hypothetical protein